MQLQWVESQDISSTALLAGAVSNTDSWQPSSYAHIDEPAYHLWHVCRRLPTPGINSHVFTVLYNFHLLVQYNFVTHGQLCKCGRSQENVVQSLDFIALSYSK